MKFQTHNGTRIQCNNKTKVENIKSPSHDCIEMGAAKIGVMVLLAILVSASVKNGVNNAQVHAKFDLMSMVGDQCSQDTLLFCSEENQPSNESPFKCLLEYENVLSESCAGYVRSLSVGACSKDVDDHCSHILTNAGLDQCIQSGSFELSPQCQWNVLRRHDRHTREKETEGRTARFSKAVTGLCGVYLLIPLALAAWAALRIYALNQQQKHFRKHLGSFEHVPPPRSPSGGAWSLEFHDLTYHVSDTPPSWLQTRTGNGSRSRRILCKVSFDKIRRV